MNHKVEQELLKRVDELPPSQKKVWQAMTLFMESEIQLDLLKRYDWALSPQDESSAHVIRAALDPLSDNKRSRILRETDFTKVKIDFDWGSEYPKLIVKYSRRNQVQNWVDVLKIAQRSLELDDKTTLDVPKWTYLNFLETIEFTFEGNSYSFFIPRSKSDFIRASLILRTCVHGFYESFVEQKTFKFFLTKNGLLLSSVEFRFWNNPQGEIVCYSFSNKRLSPELMNELENVLSPHKNLFPNCPLEYNLDNLICEDAWVVE